MRCLSFFMLLSLGLFAGCGSGEKHHDFKELSEEEIEFDAVPQKVKDAYEASEYTGWELVETEKVKTSKGTMYEIEVKKDDKQLGIYFDTTGKIVTKENETGGY